MTELERLARIYDLKLNRDRITKNLNGWRKKLAEARARHDQLEARLRVVADELNLICLEDESVTQNNIKVSMS